MSAVFFAFLTGVDRTIKEFGLGLGLAIVGQLVREIQGEISIQSLVGEGTTVTLLLNPES